MMTEYVYVLSTDGAYKVGATVGAVFHKLNSVVLQIRCENSAECLSEIYEELGTIREITRGKSEGCYIGNESAIMDIVYRHANSSVRLPNDETLMRKMGCDAIIITSLGDPYRGHILINGEWSPDLDLEGELTARFDAMPNNIKRHRFQPVRFLARYYHSNIVERAGAFYIGVYPITSGIHYCETIKHGEAEQEPEQEPAMPPPTPKATKLSPVSTIPSCSVVSSGAVCLSPGCCVTPMFNFPGYPKGYCKKHKEPGMIAIGKSQCNYTNCCEIATCGNLGCQPLRCGLHKALHMVSWPQKTCKAPRCKNFATHGPGGKRYLCANHASESDTSKMVKCDTCGIYQVGKHPCDCCRRAK